MSDLFFNSMSGNKELYDITSIINDKSARVSVTGPSDTQKIHFASCLVNNTGKKGLYVTYNEYEAKKAYEDFRFFFGDSVLFFPYREIMLYEIEAGSRETAYRRLGVLSKLLNREYKVLVLSVDSYVRKLMPADLFKEQIVSIETGKTIYKDELCEKLVYMGYKRSDTVDKKGEFTSRGGIIDIYPVNFENALRIEFFDDEIDSLRFFDPETQRSVETVQQVNIIPAEEILIKKDDIGDIIKDINMTLTNVKSEGINFSKLKEVIYRDTDKIQNGLYIPGIDRYFGFINKKPVDISNYTSDECLLFVDEYKKCIERMDIIHREYSETIIAMIEDGLVFPQCQTSLFNKESFDDFLSFYNKSMYYSLFSHPVEIRFTALFNINSKNMDLFERRMDYFINDLRDMIRNGYIIIIAAGSLQRLKSLSKVLSEEGIGTVTEPVANNELQHSRVYLLEGTFSRGFEYVEDKLVFISLRDRTVQKKKIQKSKKTMDLFVDLKPEDYVVHDIHGVGKYVGIEQLLIDNVKKDYLKIIYKGEDTLYLPVNQLDMIQKYVGPDGNTPKVNSLGGKEWAKTKSRVKESLREIAKELVDLYAKRQAIKGFAFSKDMVWQNQFEEAFPYTETDDQIKCISEIKSDMEKELVMDRLLCGDVGYGKTEVALRAVFKAVMDGKQVAYLVPTTILAQQQYDNFKARFEGFPVNVEMLSRFRSKSQQTQIVKLLEKGIIDVIVGTHRLFSQDIKFKDLGLLVIDEEQRFGVEHKEKVKQDFVGVDVLTLTATPIPRTLHMSLTGIRDISIIEDPPEERHPVRTYVLEYDAQVIKDAVYREIARGGQIFYLFNRVRGIEGKLKELSELLPGVRIGIAHGQMPERKLEDRMAEFLNGEYDILLCTTIIESGLDMPNVNTLIVENADKMGLAQLYQIRGRVGRSNRIAYAYITYKKDLSLSQIAEKRLEAIREFTDFGSGFKIAMRDMEIRGAGNLLGYEQHGHIDIVGYDTYCKLLDEAIREVRGEDPPITQTPAIIDININAYIDSLYIENESIRIELYKKIAAVGSREDAEDVIDEMIDRFGDVPVETNNLIRIALLRKMASDIGMKSVERKSRHIVLSFSSINKKVFENMSKLAGPFRGRFRFDAGVKPGITLKIEDKDEHTILDDVEKLVGLLNV